jgi:hypothetical protein
MLAARVLRRALVVGLVALAGCGGGEEEAAPALWCHSTSRIVYMLDQYSTTLTSDEIRDWEEAAPDEIAASVADAAGVLRRYPVDPDAPALVAARDEIEQFADDRCPEDWQRLYMRPPPA